MRFITLQKYEPPRQAREMQRSEVKLKMSLKTKKKRQDSQSGAL
jgi:hypothetical protein